MKSKPRCHELSRMGRWMVGMLFKHDGESKLGDFIEIYNDFANERGILKARIWFWFYLIKSIPRYGKDTLTSSMAVFKYNMIIVVRNLRRNKLPTIINLLGLTVGMVCFILIALWIQEEQSFDKFHEKKDNLYLLTITHANGILDPNVPYALAPLMADEFSEITAYTRIYEYGNIVQSTFKYQPESGPARTFNESSICLVDRDFFSMFSFSFVYGRAEEALKLQNSVVITDKIAKKYFGSENPKGKTLTLNNQRNLTVTGVIRIPSNSHLQPNFIIPLRNRLTGNWNWRDPSYCLLNPNTSLPQFKEKIAGFMDKTYPKRLNQSLKVGILPLTEVNLGFGRRTYVAIFSLIAIFILLIACINYANLASARSATRAREVGLKKVAGARHSQLIQQFLSESILVSMLAFLFAMILVNIFLPVLNDLSLKQLTFNLFQNFSMVVFLLTITLIMGILAGIYPAFVIAKQRPIDALRTSGSKAPGRSFFRTTTVVAQFVISVLLIICTAVVFKQLNFIQNRPLGISTDHVIKLPINKNLLAGFKKYKNLLLENPNILNVTAGQAVPYNEDYKTGGLEWQGKDPQSDVNVRYTISGPEYLKTFGMEVVAGRTYRNNAPADLNNFIINEKAATSLGMVNPIGKRLKFWGNEGSIIGVVKNYHHVPLHKEIMPHVFTINPRYYNALRFIFIKIRPQNIPETIAYIKEKTTLVAANLPFSYSFLDQGIAELYWAEQTLGKLFAYFAFLAIFISCLGIFALVSFTTKQKTKEIGVRKVLGSSVSGIVLLLSKRFLRWVILANLIAWPLGYLAMHKWLENFAFRTNMNLFVFLLAVFLSLVFAALPVLGHAIKAAVSNPIEALRYE